MQLKKRFFGVAAVTATLTAFGPSYESSAQAEGKPSATEAASTPVKVTMVDDHNWSQWRGPLGTGESLEHYVDGKISDKPSWTYESHGRGTPVIADGKIFSWGYKGEKDDLVIVLTCLDEATHKVLWEATMRDFISDIVYNRYSIGAPCLDLEAKRVYLMTGFGLFSCWDFDGKLLWRHSMMEKEGRLTFPNNRTGCCVIDGDLVIVRGIISNWGGEGPAADRFYAFDKNSGEMVWSSTPGEIPPKDSVFSTPIFETRDGMRIFWCGTGCGNIVAVNARNGKPLWRYKATKGGINATPLLHKGNKIITAFGEENLDNAEKGRMMAIRIPEHFGPEQTVVDPSVDKEAWTKGQIWHMHLREETSSPILVGDHVYLVDDDGMLWSINAETGEKEWTLHLLQHNIHSSPLFLDGKIFFSAEDGNLYVVKPGKSSAEVVDKIKLEGVGLSQPAVRNGKLYVHTTARLYCFDIQNKGITWDKTPVQETPAAGPAKSIQVVPSEFAMHPGGKQTFHLRKVDAKGFLVGEAGEAKWEAFIPPTAKVKASISDASFDDHNTLIAKPGAKMEAGAFKATVDGLVGIVRGRLLPAPPFVEDFEEMPLSNEHPVTENDPQPYKFAYPPLPWIGARFKFDVREVDGSKVLAKNLDRLFFQRATVFIGTEDMHDYTMQADVMTDGNRRGKSDIGLINQRYLIVVKGNNNKLEISSNYERFRKEVDFTITPHKWYTLKTRIDHKEDGSGVVRAKIWERGTPEPEAWNIEAPSPAVHRQGSPGLFAFAFQNMHRVYYDNIKITPDAAK